MARPKGKRTVTLTGAAALSVLVVAGFVFKAQIREEWLFWRLRSANATVVEAAAWELAKAGSASCLPRLFDSILNGRPSGPAKTASFDARFGRTVTKNEVIIELIKTSLGEELAKSDAIEFHKQQLLVNGTKEFHAAVLRVLAIVRCIELIAARTEKEARPQLLRVSADSTLPPVLRFLASMKLENLRQSERLRHLPAGDRQIIQGLLSPDLCDASLSKAAAAGSEATIPTIIDILVEELNGPNIGSITTRRTESARAAIRAIIERRKEAAVPVLVDVCLNGMGGDCRRVSASMLREASSLSDSAIMTMTAALSDGDDILRRHASDAIQEILREP
jgi:hypothetical protein